MGEKAFELKTRNKRYSKEFKQMVIKEYLEGKGSLNQLAIMYNISSHEVLRKWIMKYNSHIEIKDYNPKPEVSMAKSRKTTYEERIKIVHYCLEHTLSYKETAVKYDVIHQPNL
ncbi:MAG: transposase [Candidatus Izemoplasma sp.]|nr:transposase [Candidatus Izemoplasma sp.]